MNDAAITDRFDHAVKLGRERGMESPTSVSPAMATLAGRSAASAKVCTPISWLAVPMTAPRIPDRTSRAPGRPSDRTNYNQ